MHNVYSVGQVNAYIKSMFAEDFLLRSLCVRGEVSNLKYHSSGHVYFTLKDHAGALSCVMFRSDAQKMKERLKEGESVDAKGSVSVYERDGRYQLYVRSVSRQGAGALYERFAALKKRLEESGMFDPSYKLETPKYIRTLGVVTAPDGAAVRDIIQIAKRRNPYVQIILYPAIVQGEAAAPSIVKGIEALGAFGVDAMIVGRGGGSIEDLWAFNEEVVAEAIFNCPVPVVSAVGHETDFTIADFVADLRAPTPSAAAELTVFEMDPVLRELNDVTAALLGAMEERIHAARREVHENLRMLRALSPVALLRSKRQTLDYATERLVGEMLHALTRKRTDLQLKAKRLSDLSPLQKLAAGYAYVEDEHGANLRDVHRVHEGDYLRIRMTNGDVTAVAKEILYAADRM